MSVRDLLNLSGGPVIAVEEHEDRYIIQALPQTSDHTCPQCESSATAKHGKDRQSIHDLPCHAKQVCIAFD
ncbi:MAG: hypothetical protein E6J34_15545, partial [Chloroflexi bacterium]